MRKQGRLFALLLAESWEESAVVYRVYRTPNMRLVYRAVKTQKHHILCLFRAVHAR